MKEIRKRNLKTLIGDSSVAEFARTYDLSSQYLTLVLNDHRGIGEKFARKIEVNASLPTGYLDRTTDTEAPPALDGTTRMIIKELQERRIPKHMKDTILFIIRTLPEKP